LPKRTLAEQLIEEYKLQYGDLVTRVTVLRMMRSSAIDDLRRMANGTLPADELVSNALLTLEDDGVGSISDCLIRAETCLERVFSEISLLENRNTRGKAKAIPDTYKEFDSTGRYLDSAREKLNETRSLLEI
jgi:hypothetical protein